jgi:serine/threonine-protein kinase RsbW
MTHLATIRERSHEALRLTLPNDRAAIEPARQAVLQFLASHALGRHALYGVELVLEETLMNLIWHAFADDARHAIELTVRVKPDRIELRFEDDGVEFDPRHAGEPARPASLDEAAPGGLGLLLVRRFAASIDYERRDGRNHLTITVARAPAA